MNTMRNLWVTENAGNFLNLVSLHLAYNKELLRNKEANGRTEFDVCVTVHH